MQTKFLKINKIFIFIIYCFLNIFSSEKALSEGFVNKNNNLLPPKIYIDKGACPFECCSYGTILILKDTVLYEKPKSNKVIGKLSKNTTAKAITGIVYVKPLYAKVTKNFRDLKKGETVYALTYLGEGVYKIWHNEKIIDNLTLDEIENIKFDSKFYSDEWWVKFELPNKTKNKFGWVNMKIENEDSRHFCGFDLCGGDCSNYR